MQETTEIQDESADTPAAHWERLKSATRKILTTLKPADEANPTVTNRNVTVGEPPAKYQPAPPKE